MKYLAILLVCFSFPCFAAVHAVSRAAKLASYPARHPRKSARPFAKVVKFSAKQIY